MSPDNLIQWLKNPAEMDRDSLLQLKHLMEEFPCFTAARILYLKNLNVLNDLHFSKELMRTSISVPDRRRLYYFIEDKPMPEPEYSHEKDLAAGDGFSIIDHFLHTSSINEEIPDSEINVEIPDLNPDSGIVGLADSVLSPDEESISLDYVSYIHQNSTLPDIEQPEKPMQGQDLIDAFLSDSSQGKTTRIVPVESENPDYEELNRISVDLPEDTFTETLAKIYLKQKRYDQALEIFRSLSLKYPEKNVYFADQIRFLEKLITNIKND